MKKNNIPSPVLAGRHNLILRANVKSSASEYLQLVQKFEILSECEVGGPGPSVFFFSCALLYIPTLAVFGSAH